MLSRTRFVVLMFVGLLAMSVATSRAHAATGQLGYIQTLHNESAEGIAVDSSGDVFFSEDLDSNGDNVSEVKELSAQSGAVTVIAGDGHSGPSTAGAALQTSLDDPAGLALDSYGDLYIADEADYQVDEVTPAGTLSVVAGTGVAGTATPGKATQTPMRYPTDVALDSAGDVYIADPNDREVLKVDPAGNLTIVAGDGVQGTPTTGGPATSIPMLGPVGVAVDGSGNLYIADDAAAMVYRVTPAGTLSIFAGRSSGTIPADTGTPQPGPATSTDLEDPQGVAVDPYGNIVIADDSYVEKVSASGILSIVAGGGTQAVTTPGPATQADISDTSDTSGVTTDAYGNLYLTQSIYSDQTKNVIGSEDEVFGVDSADPTSTSVICATASVTISHPIQCTATVTDTASSGATAPAGAVTFSATPSVGAFSDSGTCTLSATGSGSTASCVEGFVPSQTGSYTLAGTYNGDGSHQVSAGESSAVGVFDAPVQIASNPVNGGGLPTTGGVVSTVVTTRPAIVSVSSHPASAASVQVSCPSNSAPCTATLTVSVVEKLQGGKVIAITALTQGAKRKKTMLRTVVVGTTKLTLAAGKKRTVTISLNATGRRLVAKRRLRTKLTIIQKGSKVTHTATVTFTAPRPAKKKPR